MLEKQNEQVALPIIGMVLGAMGLMISWIPIVNLFGFVMGVAGLIIIAVSFYVNRQNKKVLTYIGLGLTIAAAVVSMALHVTYTSLAGDISKAIDSEIQKEEKLLEDSKQRQEDDVLKDGSLEKAQENADIDVTKNAEKWTKAYFDQLKVGDDISGQGGISLTDVEKEVGKPTIKMDFEEEGIKARVVSWVDYEGTDVIVLVFVQQANGQWLLADKSIEKDADAEL